MKFVYENAKGVTKYPPNIPSERKNCAYKFMCIISAIILFGTWYGFNKSWTYFIITIPSTVMFLIAVEFIKRICHLIEEYNYLHTRYEKKISKLLAHIFEIRTRVIVTFFICFIFLLMTYVRVFKEEIIRSQEDLYPLILTVFSVWLCEFSLKLHDTPLYNSLWMTTMNGLDFGSCMAYSFYYGYLNIVLPRQGTADSGIKHLMECYESAHHIQFMYRKLFILVPLSFYCPESLTSNSPTINSRIPLESIIKDRAGVRERVYKNSVYSIKDKNWEREIYICCEYATPLLTFNEFLSSSGKEAAYCSKFKKDIVWQFYKTTNALIQSNDCTRDLCELIYFDDKDDFGKPIDVGLMIVQKFIKDEKIQRAKNAKNNSSPFAKNKTTKRQ